MDESEVALTSTEGHSRVPSVFLSYSRLDFYLAEQVQSLLTSHGVHVWMDLTELAPGDDWKQRIEQALGQVDAVVLLATRASVASQYVIGECLQAIKSSVPVHIIFGQACTLPALLQGLACYDARARLSSTMRILARNLVGTDIHANNPVKRFPRIWFPVAFAMAVLILTTIVCAAIGLGYLLATLTPSADASVQQISAFPWISPQTFGLPVIKVREYYYIEGVQFLASGGASATCAWALARRRWQFGFVLWASAILAVLGFHGIQLLPLEGVRILNYGGAGSQPLSSALQVLGPLSVVVSFAGVPALLMLACSLAVLRSSRSGAGSPLARFRLARSVGLGFWTAFVGIAGQIPDLRQIVDTHGLFADSDQALTFQVEANPADRKIEELLDQACRDAGMSRADEQEDRRLLVLTNANATSIKALDVALKPRAVQSIIVFGCSLPVDPDDPLLRQYQWIDFRPQLLGVRTEGQLAGRTLQVNLPITAPASPRHFRTPFGVRWELLTYRVAIFTLIAIAASDAYRGIPDGRIGMARIALSLVLAVAFGVMHRLITRRQTQRPTLMRFRVVVSSLSVLFGFVSLFATHIWTISRITFALLFGLCIPLALITKTGNEDLYAWLPAEDAAPPPEPAVPPALALQLPLIFISVMIGCVILRFLPI